jgi:hypothetical protein
VSKGVFGSLKLGLGEEEVLLVAGSFFCEIVISLLKLGKITVGLGGERLEDEGGLILELLLHGGRLEWTLGGGEGSQSLLVTDG